MDVGTQIAASVGISRRAYEKASGRGVRSGIGLPIRTGHHYARVWSSRELLGLTVIQQQFGQNAVVYLDLDSAGGGSYLLHGWRRSVPRCIALRRPTVQNYQALLHNSLTRGANTAGAARSATEQRK